MKNLLTIFILLFTTIVFSQNKSSENTNSLAVVKIKYQMLDSNAIKAIEFTLTNSKYNNILSYTSKGYIRLAYFTADKNKWTSIVLPFSEETNDFKFIKTDSGESTILIVKGVIAKSENRGRSEHRSHLYVITIINITNEPTQLFNATYGCVESEIPYDGAKETDYYYHKYERKIEVTEQGLFISSPDKKDFSTDSCQLTEVDDGTYIFDGKGLIKEK